MKNLIAFVAAVGGVFAVSPALAQDDNAFTGFKATALIGADIVRLKSDSLDISDSRTGFNYGGSLGYDAAFQGGVLVGAEAEVSGSTTKYQETASGITGKISAGRDIYLGGRIGAVVSPNALVYVKAGWTNARLNVSLTDGVDSFSGGRNFDGYRVGAGVEVARGNAFGRVEYRYSNYGHLTIDGFNSDISTQRHQVLAGIGYRF